MSLTLESFRNVLVYAEVISTADGSDCREGVVELYHTSPQFRRSLSSAAAKAMGGKRPFIRRRDGFHLDVIPANVRLVQGMIATVQVHPRSLSRERKG